MSLFASLAAGLALSTAPVPQADTLADLKPADRADLQCMAVILVMIGTTNDDEAQSMLTAGATYYYGRLEGRTPGPNWAARVRTYMLGEPFAELEANRTRCASEMRAIGELFSATAAAGD